MRNPPADDLRSLPETTLNLLLYTVAAWGVALLVCFQFDRTALAIPLTYLVFLVQAGVTAWWGRSLAVQYRAGAFSRAEADAGVLSVSRILIASSLLPAIVFLAENPVPDPFPGPGLSAAFSIFVFSAIIWGISSASVRLSNRFAHTATLLLCSLTLPINATGAFSVAAAYGLFDAMLH